MLSQYVISDSYVNKEVFDRLNTPEMWGVETWTPGDCDDVERLTLLSAIKMQSLGTSRAFKVVYLDRHGS